jgi:hypothetical protein
MHHPDDMSTPASRRLSEILSLSASEFQLAFYDYLVAKRSRREPLTAVETEGWLLLTMLPHIEMEGFVDLFCQLYTLEECGIVKAALDKLRLRRLASLFAEAFSIYTSGRPDITEEEYRAVDPFGDGPEWRRFDQIDTEILAKGSEIYLIGERVEQYVKARSTTT